MSDADIHHRRRTGAVIGVALLAATAIPPTPVARAAVDPANAERYRVVDCLLPGRVRKIGRSMTYLSPRRALRTSGLDCEIRGGEYVAADRAGFESSMAVWRPAADGGEAKAQAIVARIYAEGYGRAPDYEMAALWYKKAADQGYAPAMIDLGQLYERGQGVPKDMSQAVALYRKASGLPAANFAAATGDPGLNARYEAARAEAAARSAELAKAQADLAAERRALAELQRQGRQPQAPNGEAAALRAELARKSAELEASRAQLASVSGRLSASEAEAARSRTALEQQLRNAEADRRTLSAEREAAQREVAQLRGQTQDGQKRLAELQAERDRKSQDLAAARRASNQAEVSAAERALKAQQAQLDAAKAQAASGGARLAQAESRLAAQDGKLKANETELAGARKQIAALEAEASRSRQTADTASRERDAATRRNQELAAQVKALETKVAQAGSGRATTDPTRDREVAKREADVAVREAKVAELERSLSRVRGPTSAPLATETSRLASGRPTALSAYGIGSQYALLIGESNYRNPGLPKLQTPLNDVNELEAVLRDRYGFAVTTLKDATRAEILGAFDTMSRKLGENDTLIIYYAGHGAMEKVRAGQDRGYWLPVDGKVGSTADQISNQEITFQIARLAARKVLVISDSCYSGLLTSTVSTAQTPTDPNFDQRNFVIGMSRKPSRNVMTSGGLEPVLDGVAGQHSVFAKSLLGLLRSNTQVVTSAELYEQLWRQVVADATWQKRVGGQVPNPQRPLYSALDNAGHEAGDFLFIPRKAS